MKTTRALWAVRLQFFVSGALFATWGVHVPTVKLHFDLGERALAVAMLASGVGALLALLVAGRVIGRFGPRAVALVTGTTGAACIGAIIAFDRYAGLLMLMLTFGIVFAMFDVAINVVASGLERAAGKPLMSGLHGMFSIGGMAGAGLGSAVPLWGVSPQSHLGAMAIASIALVMLSCALMAPGDRNDAPNGPRLPAGRAVWLLGSLAALGLVAEGAMYDWSVLYVRQEVGAAASTAALGYAGFSAAMAAGRFGGDWLRARLTAVRLFQFSGALAAAGMGWALCWRTPSAALAGFALVGFGLANVVPVLFSTAGRLRGVAAADGIAGVSAMGYVGMMAGPPIIGVLAQSLSLTAGLWTVVLFVLVLAASARSALGGPAPIAAHGNERRAA